MSLLDNNVPRKVHEFLKSQSIPNETVPFRGWEKLRNGELVEAAAKAGFNCILTHDIEFQVSAAKNLKRFPTMAIVLIRLRQQRGKRFMEQFQETWKSTPIKPIAGQLIEWP
jgi:hypothetical protein